MRSFFTKSLGFSFSSVPTAARCGICFVFPLRLDLLSLKCFLVFLMYSIQFWEMIAVFLVGKVLRILGSRGGQSSFWR